MNTFKQSAIEVLKKAGMPLRYIEITRIALGSGILETEGVTPEATMNAQNISGRVSAHLSAGTENGYKHEQKEPAAYIRVLANAVR